MRFCLSSIHNYLLFSTAQTSSLVYVYSLINIGNPQQQISHQFTMSNILDINLISDCIVAVFF